MRRKVARKVSRAIPTATAMTIPANSPFETRWAVDDFCGGAWAEDVDARV